MLIKGTKTSEKAFPTNMSFKKYEIYIGDFQNFGSGPHHEVQIWDDGSISR